MDKELIEKLIIEAAQARESSYAPYSNFKVGAALLTNDGDIIRGCNIENASYGATNCAERTAIFKALSDNKRQFRAIAIMGGTEEGNSTSEYAYPCGICRQVMREFCKPDSFYIIVAKSINEYEVYLLDELLPHSFGPEYLI